MDPTTLKLKNKLILFFKDNKNNEIFFNIINKKEGYSLRVLEWFVTYYCKINKIIYNYTINGKNNEINIYRSYKSYLKSYTKERFDPFKRTKKNSVCSEKFDLINNKTNDIIKTSMCQLNFFHWFISNCIHKYIKTNLKVIKIAMNEYYNNTKNTTVKKKKPKNSIIKQDNNNKNNVNTTNSKKITKKFN